MKLKNIDMSDVLNDYVDCLMNYWGIKSKEEAKNLVVNALTYNVVMDAVVEQAVFLKRNEEE